MLAEEKANLRTVLKKNEELRGAASRFNNRLKRLEFTMSENEHLVKEEKLRNGKLEE